MAGSFVLATTGDIIAPAASKARYARSVKRTVAIALLSVGLALGGYLIAGAIASRLTTPGAGPLPVTSSVSLPAAGNRLSVLTWNLGYAGLGAGSDFAADGGEHYFPPSRATVESNLAGIRSVLEDVDADVFLFQEIATSSPLNYWVNVLKGIEPRFTGFDELFTLDVRTRLLLPPLRVAHGKGIFARKQITEGERVALPLEDEFLAGVVRNNYSLLVARLPMEGTTGEWVVINLHLAAFDEDGTVRRAQLQEALRFGQREYAAGNAVILGGDFNMEFVRDRFAHTTADEDRFWLEDFPFGQLPAGWQTAFDRDVPSVRTVNVPYMPGVNYLSVVDGFIFSPNVRVERVSTADMGFAYSDHQAVGADFVVR